MSLSETLETTQTHFQPHDSKHLSHTPKSFHQNPSALKQTGAIQLARMSSARTAHTSKEKSSIEASTVLKSQEQSRASRAVKVSRDVTGNETKPQQTRKIKETKAQREPPSKEVPDFGRHRDNIYEWVCTHDKQYCVWAVITVGEQEATASPQLRRFAAHAERTLGTPQRAAARTLRTARRSGPTPSSESEF